MAKIVPMVSMELDDESKLDAAQPIPMPMRPDFPYGLRITLTQDELEKLDLDARDAFVGGIIHGHFLGRITSVSQDSTTAPGGNSKETQRLEIQIEDLAIESEDEEGEEEEGET